MQLDLAIMGRGSVVTIGNFDGVHLGHRALIERLIDTSKRLKTKSMVFTFDPPPLKLLRPEITPKPLTWNARRAELLNRLGVDQILFYPTNTDLLRLTPVEFFERILIDQLGIRGIVEGPNFRFGQSRAGDIQTLKELANQHRIAIEIIASQNSDQKMISSTQIREAIQTGNIRTANQLLSEPYHIRGTVGHGAARGRTLGFPTANLEQVEVLVPPHGVYAARGVAPSSVAGKPIALHIGPNPTFGEDASKIEAHIVGFEGNLYDDLLELELIDSVRAVRKFESKEDLLAQLDRDIAQVVALQ